MNKKGKFIEVVGIRTYEVTEDGRTVTKWVVKYLLEAQGRHNRQAADSCRGHL